MRMKKILNEWRRFVIKESIEKSNFEKTIESSWQETGQPYNEELTYVKAALHAALYMNGGKLQTMNSILTDQSLEKLLPKEFRS